MKLKHIIFSLLLVGVSLSQSLYAQSPETTVRGTVVESTDNLPIEFATIVLIKKGTEEKLAGTTTKENGQFSLKTKATDFIVEVSFIGFQTRQIKDFKIENGKVELGTIKLSEGEVSMEEVVIAGEKSSTEFKLDKRVFNVGRDLSSTGASALEVLNNVPSVNVSIEGAITLRGSSGVQILINGKPSVLASEEGNALGTITADMIEKIEVITNPSAKYEAEGTSGIINIILKKEERKGLNGSFTINGGIPHNHSFGLSLNRRTEKWNLFSQLGVGYREMPSRTENINQDLVNNTSIISNGMQFRNENFYNLILGTDYHINKYNVLTLSGSFAYEVESQPSETNFESFDADNNSLASWRREENTTATNPKYQYEFNYKKDFKDHKEHDLVFSALGRFFGKDQSSEFSNIELFGKTPVNDQQTRTNFQEANYTFKLDYTKPFSEKVTVETGSQYVIQDVGNDFAVSDLVDGEWVNDPNQTNNFEYDQKVLGAYATGAYEGTRWGLKLGLRLENTDLQTLLVTTNEANQLNYTNLFPSAHTSYKISEFFSLQAGYSRRIFRPRLWDLNPFFNPRNNFNIRTGNPDLLPEFTDSYELASVYLIGKASLNFGVFHRYTTDVIERITLFEDGVNITKPFNIGTNRATGLEFNAKYSPAKWLTFNGDFNYLYFSRKGIFEQTDFDFSANQWSTKLNTKFKLPAQIDAEVTGHYRSKVQTVQGIRSGNIFADLGVRKKLMNGKAIVNLSVRDVFASRIRETNTFQPDFYTYSFSQRGRFIVLGFSYGFGKGEAMEFSGQKRHH
jgi:outer membrane receptor protein involved in Fe transport